MPSAFDKEIARSIRRSAGRFAAIVAISLLGAGFFAGLRMAGPDMRIAGDEFFDDCNLYDLCVVSTLGLDDDSVSILEGVEGIDAVMPAHRIDALVNVHGENRAAVMESIPNATAQDDDAPDGARAVSGGGAYLNQLLLREGAWPQSDRECVVGFNAADELGASIGDELVLAGQSAGSLSEGSLTIVGFVNSPAYVSWTQLGSSPLGNGEIELYLYVPETAFPVGEPYTVVYLEAADARGEQWGTKAYDDAVAKARSMAEGASGELAAARRDAIRDGALSELTQAKCEYERQKAAAQSQLVEAEAQLASSRAWLDAACEQLADGKIELDAAAVRLADAEARLNAGEEEYAKGKAAFDAQVVGYKAGLESGLSQVEGALSQAREAGVPANRVDEAERIVADTAAMLDKPASAQRARLASFLGQLDVPDEELASLGLLPDQIAMAKEAVSQIEARVAELDVLLAQAEAAETQLASARAQLDAARAELERGRAEREAGVARYEAGMDEYWEGEARYAAGLAEYEAGKAAAERELAAAERQLADAQGLVDALEAPEIFVMGRDKNTGAAHLSSDSDGMSQIATFLPFIFFLVAALVVLTSMTRMVDEERAEIGTHKALGYSRGRITSKYLIYGMLASGVGSVAGVASLGQLLPWFVLTSYQVKYAMPSLSTPIDPLVALVAVGLSVGITAAATWGAAAATLREGPAALMLPRAPKAGKRILLERIGPLWSRLSFSWKVTARNLLRHKRRFAMAVVGIAGCTALLMVGFGLRDTVDSIIGDQYGEITRYDAVVHLDGDVRGAGRDLLASAMEDAGAETSAWALDFTALARNGGGADEGNDLRIEVVVPQSAGEMSDLLTLREREGGRAIGLREGEVAITEKAATELGLRVGDEVELYGMNLVGDATGDAHRLVVGGIAENYAGHRAFMLPGTYRAAFGDAFVPNVAFARLAEGVDARSFSGAILEAEGVSSVGLVDDEVVTFQTSLDLMGSVIGVIIALSAALAFVVLYNLTNINVAERVREIATLKVLGFTKGEVNAYIFREIVIMVAIGALIGCVLGLPLALYVAQAAETPSVMFGRTIEPASYALSFSITMAFAAVVAFVMRGKLAKVGMVESLKSVE